MTAIRFEKDHQNIVTLTMDMPGQSANTMNADYRAAMDETLAKLEAEKDDIAGVVLTSAKKTFFAGGDLRELVAVKKADAPEFAQMVTGLKAQLRRLETFGKPVVAAINGAALGGGFEIALACHHRVVLNSAKVQLGLPEVTLGLLPGGGGVVRMVRKLGIEASLPYLAEGKKVRPEQALKAGLIEELADSAEELISKSKAWILANPDAVAPWDVKGYKIPGGTPSNPKLAQRLVAAPAMMQQKTFGCFPAPIAILSAATEGAQTDFDNAEIIETRYFTELVTGKVSKNMINAFWFQLNSINAGGARPDSVEPLAKGEAATKKVGIIGAGMMGAGIAYVSANKGIEVVLKDVSVEAAEKGKAYSEKLLDKKLSRGFITQEKKDEILGRILATADHKDFEGCDLIIEAVFEDRGLKAKVTQEAESVLEDSAIIASNTSTLPISGLAEAVKDSEKFVGIHFFSPVDKMPLVEIIKGKETGDVALAKAFDYVLQIGKTPIVVNDSRGFYTSRVFALFAQEGIAMLGEGNNASVIDTEARKAGFPVGPLAVTDEVSMSLIEHIRNQTKADAEAEGRPYADHPAYAVIEKMIGFDRKGRAAGAGFYDYPAGGKKHFWPELSGHFEKAEQIPNADVRDRLLFVMALETVKCLQENVLTSIADANIGSIFGIAFPAWAGGAIQFINQYGEGETDGEGVRAFLKRARELNAAYGDRFEIPALLEEKAEKGEGF